MTPFQAHLVFYPSVCWVAASFISAFSCLLIIHVYSTFWCFMMICTSSKGTFAIIFSGSNAWWWTIAYWIESSSVLTAVMHVRPFYLPHPSVYMATAYPYHPAVQRCHTLFFFPLSIVSLLCCQIFPLIYLHIYVAVKPLPSLLCPFPTWPWHLSVSPLPLFSLFVWNLLSSWNISSNHIGKSKGTTLLILWIH